MGPLHRASLQCGLYCLPCLGFMGLQAFPLVLEECLYGRAAANEPFSGPEAA